jgi:hypothetical protein
VSTLACCRSILKTIKIREIIRELVEGIVKFGLEDVRSLSCKLSSDLDSFLGYFRRILSMSRIRPEQAGGKAVKRI